MSDGAGFDSLTDKSGQGAKVSDDDIWKAITEVASGGCGVEEVRAVEPIHVAPPPAMLAEVNRLAALTQQMAGLVPGMLASQEQVGPLAGVNRMQEQAAAAVMNRVCPECGKAPSQCDIAFRTSKCMLGGDGMPLQAAPARTGKLHGFGDEPKSLAWSEVSDPTRWVHDGPKLPSWWPVDKATLTMQEIQEYAAAAVLNLEEELVKIHRMTGEAEDKRQPFGKAMSYSSLVESVHAMLRENPGRAVLPKRLWPGPGMVTEVPAGEIVTRPAELTTTNVRLPDGRMLDDVLAENTKMKAQLAAYLCAPQAHGITVEPPPADEQDLGTLSDDDMMAACGADGVAWARAFCQILDRRAKNGPVHLDRDGMATWFVSAIETAAATRHNQAQTIYAPGKGWPFHWVMREDGPQLWMTNGHGDWWQAAMDRLAVPTLTCTQMAARELPSGYMGPAYA